MAKSSRQVEPRTFFLNETHELSPVEKPGGGRAANYVGVSWAAKSKQIHDSLDDVADKISSSHDPLKDARYFVLAQPVAEVEKASKNKKVAPTGTFKEKTAYGGMHGRVFDRLGLDLLQVTEDGSAIVHAESEKFDQLRQRSASLDKLGSREQARWVTIESFTTVPLELRVDADWLQSLKVDESSDVVIELQPVLTRLDADKVLRAIADILVEGGKGQKLTGTGADFSGRHWFRGKATQRSVRRLARDFFSVQSIHSPLYSIAAGKSGRPAAAPVAQQAQVDFASLPCVAVIDLGVPADHARLKPFRRGQFTPQDAPRAPIGDHGSFVASRVVFGEHADRQQLAAAAGNCRFYDAMVGEYPFISGSTNRVNDKLVMPALDGVRGAAPDVRVFNLSIGDTRPLDSFPVVERTNKRLSLQDLDNFIFANDKLVVVAAGNSELGVSPDFDYPEHHQDPRWALGPWACGFNTLVCGSFVPRLSAHGLVKSVGWPSPFTRIGPGLCSAPIPSFSAEGGNTNDAYGFSSGLGVWGLSGSGLLEDRIGTSHAAPILAREAALTLQKLQEVCEPGGQPFAVTARAFLTLTAEPPVADPPIQALVERTLGCGRAQSDRLYRSTAGSAVLLWQGYIESPDDKVRVQLPIPLTWLSSAQDPILKIVVCYDPPVSETAHATWACRKVSPVLHLGPDAPSVRAPGGSHASYPVIRRQYHLGKYRPGNEMPAEDDMWLLELAYAQVAPYPPGMDFDPRQRVAFAAELLDIGESPVDPQPAMQALPTAAGMTRLSVQPAPIRSPIIVKTRI
jgi:hypothetical protein